MFYFITFVGGLMVGAFGGIIICALCAASAEDEEKKNG